MAPSGMWMMKMGNIAARAVIEPTFVVFLASMLTITPCRLPDVSTLYLHVYVAACWRGQCRPLSTCITNVQTASQFSLISQTPRLGCYGSSH